MGAKKKIALLSNVTVDLLASRMRKRYEFYVPEGYDAWVQEAINSASGLYAACVDAVVVLLDGTEARSWKSIEIGQERMGEWQQTLVSLANQVTDAPIFISIIDIRENRIRSLSERIGRYVLENSWYQFVQGLVEMRDNVFILDVADVIAEIGRKQFYSDKMWYLSGMPYSGDGLIAASREITRVLDSAFETRKKVAVLDLDNTLWGGVVGEDGIEGIELSDHKEGQRFYDFQRQLLEMRNRGFVLAIDSKNNVEDAEAVIMGHPAMLLRDDDFVSRKINWENKATNLRAISQELNITEGGFVFIDDNPAERETVRGMCPEALVPEFPTDTPDLLSFAEDLWSDSFRPLRVLHEDKNKTRMYKSEAKRNEVMQQSLNIDDYLSKLEVVADIHLALPEELQRVAQLCSKTNQFNATTKRYTQAEIEELASDDNCDIYVAYSSDKYGDSGLVSVMILKRDGKCTVIDTFLMSCRVMGRKLENVIVNEIASRLSGKLVGTYIPTTKNAPVSNLYDRLDFTLLTEEEGCKTYELDLAHYEKKAFEMYKSVSFGG